MMHKIVFKTAFIFILLLSAGCAKHATSISKPPVKAPVVKAKPIELVIINRKAESIQPVFSSPKKKTPKPLTIWERMVSLYKISDISNKRINREYQWYLKHPDYLERIQKRAAPYLYNILEQIEVKGLPGELALLPAIESAFRPHAYSRKKAAGLWQFIPSTGRHFGLKQNWWYDGRRDVFASTDAATQYLKQLSNSFKGDWLLALASYNAGKSRINRAIRRNKRKHKPTDYWSLRLPKETMNYVPRLLAIAKIFADAKSLNISLLDIPDQPAFVSVDVGSQLSLAKAAKLADMTLDEFFKFNPGFNRWHTAPNGPHRLLIPVNKAKRFREKLAKLPKNQRIQWRRHKIRSGENLSLIAKKYRTSVKSLREANRMASNTIHAGRFLLIPTTSSKHLKHPLRPKRTRIAKKRHLYIVKKGDTFWDISRKFAISSKKLALWNKLSLKSILQPGQKLIIKNI
jgi:membrane-bound lytic murein transglycosylase D